MITRRLTFCISLLIVLCCATSAATYDYYGKAGLRLGSGFRKLNLSSIPPPCLVVSKETVSQDQTVGRFQLETKLIRDRAQLYNLLHIDAHLAARSLAVTANVDTSFDKETSMESDDLTWIMYAYQEFGSETIDPVLNGRGSPYKKNASALIQRCGQEYVQSVKKASQIAAIFTLHSLNNATKTTLTAHFAGGASWGGSDVQLSANYKNFLSEASQHGSVEVKMFGFGGGGLTELPDIVRKGDDFDTVRSVLADYIKREMVASKAIPISFTTASFGELADPPLSTSPVGDPPGLDSTYIEYGNTLSRIRKAEEMLGGRNERFGYVTDNDVAYLSKTKKELAVRLSKLQLVAKECNQSSEKCAFPEIDSTVFKWPLSPEPNCSRWESGVCAECEVPVNFISQLTGASFMYTCTHMKEGASVHVRFEGLYITVNDAEPDNKVWNTWINASVTGLNPCTKCSASRVSPGLGAPPPNQTQFDYFWKLFDFDGTTTVAAGTAKVRLTIDHCQAGNHATTCDSSPPGTGTPLVGAANPPVVNRGFPVPYPPAPARVRFTAE